MKRHLQAGILAVFCATGSVHASDKAPTGEIWAELRASTEQLLSSISAFVASPTKETWQASDEQWQKVLGDWKQVAPDYTADPHQRNWTRWLASKRVAEDDLESLIGASTCPVPFSTAMLRLLSADMQGLHTIEYLLQTHPEVESPTAADMAALYEAQPRRGAYLRSTTMIFEEKVTELLSER